MSLAWSSAIAGCAVVGLRAPWALIRVGFCLAVAGVTVACQRADIGPKSADERKSEKPIEHVAVRIDRDGALILEGRTIARKDLAEAFANLAERVRNNARMNGIPIDPEGPLPASIVIQADDETPCRKLFSLWSDWQESGFARFSMESSHPEPVAAGPAEARPATIGSLAGRPWSRPVVARPRPGEDGPAPLAKRKSSLPVELRTIPIVCKADDRGQIGVVEVGEIQRHGFEPLKAEVISILNDPDLLFDQADVTVDPGLHYSELRRIVNLLVVLNVTKISFALAEL